MTEKCTTLKKKKANLIKKKLPMMQSFISPIHQKKINKKKTLRNVLLLPFCIQTMQINLDDLRVKQHNNIHDYCLCVSSYAYTFVFLSFPITINLIVQWNERKKIGLIELKYISIDLSLRQLNTTSKENFLYLQ